MKTETDAASDAGWNVDFNAAPLGPTKPTWRVGIEYHWKDGKFYQAEYHVGISVAVSPKIFHVTGHSVNGNGRIYAVGHLVGAMPG